MSLKYIEKNAESLLQIDSDKKDTKITITEFNSISDDKKLLESISGSPDVSEWNEFKNEFIRYQSTLGFIWTPLQGQGGPIGLQSVLLSATVGQEIGQRLLELGKDKGNFIEEIKHHLPMLSAYIEDNIEILDLTEAREAFKDAAKNNEGYRFKPGRNGLNFKKSKNEYTYNGKDTRKTEEEFGEAIKDHLKTALNLTKIIHVQSERRGGKYQNVDLEGFKVRKGISTDEFLMYNFELKPSNKISSISEAISQAINYKYEAHYTYIVIPNFNQDSFYDSKRFSSFKDLCSTNSIGIISIEMNAETNEIIDTLEVLDAKQTELESTTRLGLLIKDSVWEICPLCNRIINSETRENYPWMVGDKDNVKCMKLIMEIKLTE